MIHVNLDSRKEHKIEDAHLTEYLETGVTLKQSYSVRAHDNTRHNHSYDVGNLQLVKQQRCEQNYDQYDEEYQYRISHQGQSRFKHHNCGSIFFTVTKLNIFSQ